MPHTPKSPGKLVIAPTLATKGPRVREREKDLLLSLIADMATIRDREDLFRVMFTKLKPIIGFEDAVVSMYSADFTTYKHFVTASPPERMAHPLFKEIVGVPLPVAGNPDEYVLAQVRANGLLRWDTVAIQAAYPDHFIGGFLRENGLLYNVYIALTWAGQLIGFINFHFAHPAAVREDQYGLYRTIADQIAVAVANILANEDIQRREQETALQLAVTTALTNSEEWAEKFRTVVTEIGRVVSWDRCGIQFHQRPARGLNWHRPAPGVVESMTTDRNVRELGVAPLTLRALARQALPLHQEPALFGGDAFEQLAATYELVRLMRDKWQVQSQLYLPVRLNGELGALLMLSSQQPDFYQPAQLALLQRLAPQLALGLENLFSFEKLAERERERTRQLALNNALVTITNSYQLYKTVAEELSQLVSLDSLSAWAFTPDRLLHFTVVRREADGFLDITEPSRAAYPELEATETEVLMTRDLHPGVYTGEAFAAQCDRYLVYRIRRDQFGMASALELPLPVRNGIRSLLVLGSRVAFAFTEADLHQLLLFTPQIALAVENLVAHEEIRSLKQREEQEKKYLAEEIKTTHNFEEMVGISPALHQVFRQVGQVAATDATVLITGETGTGKELIARTLHNQSRRRERTLIKLNCAALPSTLIESELFGHEKGAFTGAIEKRVGKFELAQGSTIFLDEIGELPLELQSKLLRVLQEREFERVGGNKVLKADVRVVAATNRDLAEEVAAGRFRADLYYRLSVFPIHMPALRKRPEDIPLLAQHFARKFSRALGKPYCGVQEMALQELLVYDWPGNIRELENLVEQAVIVCPGPLEWARPLRPVARLITQLAPLEDEAGEAATLREERDDLERRRILAALRQCNGRIRGPKGAALVLGLKPTTLESKMEKLGIPKRPRYGVDELVLFRGESSLN